MSSCSSTDDIHSEPAGGGAGGIKSHAGVPVRGLSKIYKLLDKGERRNCATRYVGGVEGAESLYFTQEEEESDLLNG